MHTEDKAVLACSCWPGSSLSAPTTPRVESGGKRKAATGRASPLPPHCLRTLMATPTCTRSPPGIESCSPNPLKPSHGHSHRPCQPRRPAQFLRCGRSPALHDARRHAHVINPGPSLRHVPLNALHVSQTASSRSSTWPPRASFPPLVALTTLVSVAAPH